MWETLSYKEVQPDNDNLKFRCQNLLLFDFLASGGLVCELAGETVDQTDLVILSSKGFSHWFQRPLLSESVRKQS